jgi:hypothetical protein
MSRHFEGDPVTEDQPPQTNPKGFTMTIPDALPVLASGAHDPGSRQMCAMEAASWLANEKFTDQPECVHPASSRDHLGKR